MNLSMIPSSEVAPQSTSTPRTSLGFTETSMADMSMGITVDTVLWRPQKWDTTSPCGLSRTVIGDLNERKAPIRAANAVVAPE